MLLVFPTAMGLSVESDEKISYLRSLDKEQFNRLLSKRLKAGWVVHEMKSSFRKTAFGGSTAYYAELRRRLGGGKKEQLSSS